MNNRQKKLQDLFATSAVIQRMMHMCFQRAFDELGIAPSQLHILQLIEHTQPIGLKQLAADMRLTPGAITQLIESLVKIGYVERTAGTADRRIIEGALTDQGKEKIAILKRKKQALLQKVVADLDDNELEIFLRVQ